MKNMLVYPIYKFKCGHEAGYDNILSQRGKKTHGVKFKCPICGSRQLVQRFQKCVDCGDVFEIKTIGKMPTRCKDCQLIETTRVGLVYYHNVKKEERKNPIKRTLKGEFYMVKTNLKPDPVVTNLNQAPCNQGCNIHKLCVQGKMSKYNSTCVECAYRNSYANRVESSYAPVLKPERESYREVLHK